MNQRIKKVFIILIYVGIILLSTKVYATSGSTINDSTRLRKEPSTSSETLDLVDANTEVEIISEDGDWYKVKYNNSTGYMRKDMILTQNKDSKNEEENSNVVENKESNNVSENNTLNVKENEKIKAGYTGILNSNLQIKILPSINSSIIYTLTSNTEFKVTDIINKWGYIETENASGWVLLGKINNNTTSVSSNTKAENQEEPTKQEEQVEENKISNENKEEEKETNKEEETTKNVTKYVSTATLNLREKPDNSGNIIVGLEENTEVTILEEVDSTWSKVKAKGKTGYVASKFLSDTKVTISTRSEDETRTSNSNTNTEQKEEEESSSYTENTTVYETTSETSAIGTSVVEYAKQFLGNPYVYGGTSLTSGCDCSGFVMSVYAHFGYSLPHSSSSMRSVGKAVSKSDLQPGDILCFSGHVGIYMGDNMFIHAANESKGIITTSLSSSYYVQKYVGARRIIN